jgi:hypothetical protein
MKRFALPHLTHDLLESYPQVRTNWDKLDPKYLSHVVKGCIVARKLELHRDRTTHETAMATAWYESANFTSASLTQGDIGGQPGDNVGLAWIFRFRVSAFTSSATLVGWGRIPPEFGIHSLSIQGSAVQFGIHSLSIQGSAVRRMCNGEKKQGPDPAIDS